MTISCIANGSKKVLLWAGASCASFYVVDKISNGILKVGQAYLDYPKSGLPQEHPRIFSILLSGFCVPVLVVLPFRKVAVCATLLAYGVLCGLAELYRFKQVADKKSNEILNVFWSDSPFKTPREVSEFHRSNNELIAKENVKEAKEACIRYMQPYLDTHPQIGTTFTVSSTAKNFDTLSSLTNDEEALRVGVLYAVETNNYSLLICFSLMGTVTFILAACKTLEQKNFKQYELFCELFGSETVDNSCRWILINCYKKSKDLHSFWLLKLWHVKLLSARQLRSRENGLVLEGFANKLSSIQQKQLVSDVVCLQNKRYIFLLQCQDVGLNFTFDDNKTPIWCLIKEKFHRGLDIEFVNLLIQRGADLHHRCDGQSILDSLFLSMSLHYSTYGESSHEWKIISYLIKKGVQYNSDSVPLFLVDRLDELKSSLALN